jgi:hypothetical protein
MRYMGAHKLFYVILMASRKMGHYFKAHNISVVISCPLQALLHSPNATRNIAKWAVELAEYELDFIPRHTVNS